MSAESENADRWRQVFAGAADRPDTYCHGCGGKQISTEISYHRVVHGTHRTDCTARQKTEAAERNNT